MSNIKVHTVCQSDVCPVCSGELEYTGVYHVVPSENGGIHEWHCTECGASGYEGYNNPEGIPDYDPNDFIDDPGATFDGMHYRVSVAVGNDSHTIALEMFPTQDKCIQELSTRYGWPVCIHLDRKDGFLEGITAGSNAIYKFPDGSKTGDKIEEMDDRAAHRFYILKEVLRHNPADLYHRIDLFDNIPSDWFKELALFAMEEVSKRRCPKYFSVPRNGEDGDLANAVTSAIFEEADSNVALDPEFINQAKALLPYYVKVFFPEDKG